MSQERTEQQAKLDLQELRITMQGSNSTDALFAIDAIDAAEYWIAVAEQRREERDSNQRLHIQSLAEIDRLNAVNAEQAEYIDAINKSSDGLDTAVYLHMCHIERLNAVIGNYKSLSDQDAREIKRLTDLVDKQIEIISGHNDGMALAKYLYKKDQEKIIDLTAKVQERDAVITGQAERLQHTEDALNVANRLALENRKTFTQLESENSDLTAKVQERDREIQRSREIIIGTDEQVNEQAEEIERLKAEAESALKWGQEQRANAKALKQAWYDALPTGDKEATAGNMRAEIERLRAALVVERDKADEFLNYMAVDRIDAALEGAE